MSSSPLPPSASYQRYKIEGSDANRGSNQLQIKISEQRKKSRLILQSGIYIFCVTNISEVGHGLSSSETTYTDKVKLRRYNLKWKDSVQCDTIITCKKEKANFESL